MINNAFYFNLKIAISLYKLQLRTIAIHILPNISRSRGNQATKFGQLIEYNMRAVCSSLFLLYANLRAINI